MPGLDLSQLGNNLSLEPDILIFLITLPLVITIISFAKYVMGFKSFGVYVPILLTFMFYELSRIDPQTFSITQGLKYGLFITAIVFISSYVSYKIIQPLALHYYSKLAIVTTNVTISLLLVLFVLDLIDKEGILRVDIFSLILIASISERFTNLLASKQTTTAFMLSFQTILLGLICFFVISTGTIQNAFLNYPWLILLTFPINYIIGKFTGLRVTEIFRFKDLLNKESEV
jgi:hypothetical protein